MFGGSVLSGPRVDFREIEHELRRRTFGILSTTSRTGRPHSTGVLYGVSSLGMPLRIYVMTQRKTKKVRNISSNPNVSFVVPLSRRLVSLVPPNCIQFQGTADVVDGGDRAATNAFTTSYILSMMLQVSSRIDARLGEVCFIRVTPDPVIFTYGLGLSFWQLRKHIEHAGSRVEVPPERR